MRYPDGFKFFTQGSCDSHYVAFNCDSKIDELYSADVVYVCQSFHHPSSGSNQYGDLVTHNVTLSYSDKVSNPADGFLATKYTWDRIERVSDFVAKEFEADKEYEAKNQLKGKQWVLRFAETAYSKSILPGSYGTVYDESKTIVTSVSILRLHFKSAGKVYNLGVVDDKRSGDDVPGNEDPPFDFWQWLADLLNIPVWAAKLIVYGVGALIVFAIALPILSLIFPVVGQVVKIVLKAIWWVISAPFRFIGWIIRKIRGGD